MESRAVQVKAYSIVLTLTLNIARAPFFKAKVLYYRYVYTHTHTYIRTHIYVFVITSQNNHEVDLHIAVFLGYKRKLEHGEVKWLSGNCEQSCESDTMM